jgi:hypothetical protein
MTARNIFLSIRSHRPWKVDYLCINIPHPSGVELFSFNLRTSPNTASGLVSPTMAIFPRADAFALRIRRLQRRGFRGRIGHPESLIPRDRASPAGIWPFGPSRGKKGHLAGNSEEQDSTKILIALFHR